MGVRPGKAGPFFGDGTTDNLGTGCGALTPNLGGGVSAADSGNTDCGALCPKPEVGGGSFGPEPGIPSRGSEPKTRCCASSGPEPPAGAELGPDPGTGGGAFGPDPGMGGDATFGPDPGMDGDSFSPEPGCGSFGPKPEPPAGGGLGLGPEARNPGTALASAEAGRGVDDKSARPGAAGACGDGPTGGRLSSLISWAMIATSLGAFQPSMPSFQTWTDCSGLRDTMYLAASAQLSGPCSTPSTATNHSCSPEGGREGFDEGRAADAELARTPDSGRLEESCGPAITSPACTVMTLPQVLQRMRRIRCLTFSSAME
jgi:hypothetical protein